MSTIPSNGFWPTENALKSPRPSDIKLEVLDRNNNVQETLHPEQGEGCIENLSFNQRYTANAAVTVAGTIFMNALVRLVGDDSFSGSKANKSGKALISLMVPSSFVSANFKGNWRDVDSHSKQLLTLAGYAALSTAADALFYFADPSSNAPVIGQTTLAGVSDALGYLTKMAAKKTMGLPSYAINAPKAHLTPEEVNKGTKLCLALLAGISAGTAMSSQFIDTSSAAALMINATYSKVFGKIGKTLLKVQELKDLDKKGLKNAKLKMAALCTAVAIVTAAVIGGAVPFTSSANLSNVAFHYFGPTAAIAFSGLATNIGPRAFEKKKETQVAKAPKKEISLKKKIINWVLLAGSTSAAAVTHALNTNYFTSKVVGLGTKLCQLGWSYHSMREIMKGMGNARKICVLAGSMALSIGVEAAAAGIATSYGFSATGGGSWNYPTATVTAAVAARFLGKMVREKFLPKTAH